LVPLVPVVLLLFLVLLAFGGVSYSEESESSSSESLSVADIGCFGIGIGAEDATVSDSHSSVFFVAGIGMLRERRYLIFMLS